jgi:hypothetical protein
MIMGGFNFGVGRFNPNLMQKYGFTKPNPTLTKRLTLDGNSAGSSKGAAGIDPIVDSAQGSHKWEPVPGSQVLLRRLSTIWDPPYGDDLGVQDPKWRYKKRNPGGKVSRGRVPHWVDRKSPKWHAVPGGTALLRRLRTLNDRGKDALGLQDPTWVYRNRKPGEKTIFDSPYGGKSSGSQGVDVTLDSDQQNHVWEPAPGKPKMLRRKKTIWDPPHGGNWVYRARKPGERTIYDSPY